MTYKIICCRTTYIRVTTCFMHDDAKTSLRANSSNRTDVSTSSIVFGR